MIVIGPGAVKTPIWDKGVDPEPYRDTVFYKPMKRFIDLFVEEGIGGKGDEFISVEFFSSESNLIDFIGSDA